MVANDSLVNTKAFLILLVFKVGHCHWPIDGIHVQFRSGFSGVPAMYIRGFTIGPLIDAAVQRKICKSTPKIKR